MQKPDLKQAAKRTKAGTVTDYSAADYPAELLSLGKGKTYYIRTYGCQANFHDSELLAGILEKTGFTKGEFETADVVLLNTCAIRENAEDKVYGEIGILKHEKEMGRKVLVGIGGCMVQQPSIVEKIRNTWPMVDLIYGTHNLVEIPYLLKEAMNKDKTVIEVLSIEGKIFENVPFKRDDDYKAWVSIMDGCDKFCTYCIVPFTRGKQRSRTIDNIVNEVFDLKEKGYKEVCLLGQNVNAFGKDSGNNEAFADLLEKTARTGIERIRFMTSHPWDFVDKTIEVIHNYPNIMPYFHLPVQSGSDTVLKKMNRRYNIAEYKSLFDKLKSARKDCAISTDIIVGFPYETEEDFNKTLELYDYCKFDSAFTFAYSPRTGTPAASYKDQIEESVKLDRLKRLNQSVSKYGLMHNQEYINKTVKVLCDGPSKKNENIYSGYSETNKLVNFIPKNASKGDIVEVEITDAKSWTLDGKQV